MSEKRYLVKGYGFAPNGENIFGIFDTRTKSPYHLYAFNDDGLNKIARIMNEQQDQIIYWKHKVNSLLFILSQFDEEKVKELLKELEDEREENH